MNRATFAVRSVGFSVVSVMAALALSPSPVQASDYYSDDPYINNCLEALDPEAMLSEEYPNPDSDQASQCAPGTSAVNPLTNNNLVRPTLDVLNTRFGHQNAGGPVAAYRRAENPAAASELARWVERETGAGMPAGVTPRETTGEAISRWMQPLRDHHISGWFNTTWTSPRDNYQPTRYDSDIWTLTLGADAPLTILSDKLLLGFFGSITNSDVDTTYNNGDVESKVGTLGSYISYQMNQNVALDLTFAGMFGEHDNVIGQPGGGPSNPNARGDQDFGGVFLAANANGNYWVGNIGLQGRIGFMYSTTETDDYVLRSGLGSSVHIDGQENDLAQFSFATQVNYFLDQGLPYLEQVKAMPFLRMTFNYDMYHEDIKVLGPRKHPNDEEEVVIGWGANFFGEGPVSGSIEAGHTFARDRFESWLVSGTITYAF